MSRKTERETILRSAMESLIPNQNFQRFLEAIRELKEGAVMYAVQHNTIRDQRESLAALGEVRAYADILAIAESHENAIEHGIVDAEPLPPAA